MKLIDALKKKTGFSGQILFDEPLAKHTYYRIGGPARALVFPKSREDLQALAEVIAETRVPYFVMGQGSNLLVSDAGFSGLVIRVSKLNLEIRQGSEAARGRWLLHTGGSVAVSTLLRRCGQEGWGGLEFLTGIPGLIGGVVWMNAGTHLGEAKDRLKSVEVVRLSDGQSAIYQGAELKMEYRKNLFLPPDAVVWEATWEVDHGNPVEIEGKIRETLARRKTTQPIDYPSCGSVFKNPKAAGVSAWQVVDRLGLRGHTIGGAQFSEKHSNFIVNLGNARAADVKALIELAKSRARAELGIELEEEVIYLE